MTVSNIKLDDVFSDVFGKASTNIINRLLENPTEKITDVLSFRTNGMKATNEEVLAAVDGEICLEQAEKLWIIRSHMDSLELCKLNTESLILSVAEKYIPQINLVSTVPGIKTFAAIGVLSEISVDMSVFPSPGTSDRFRGGGYLHPPKTGLSRNLCYSLILNFYFF